MIHAGTDPAWRPPGAADPDKLEMLADPGFRTLVRQRDRLGLTVVGLTAAIYFGFVALLAFAPRLMHEKVSGVITVGFPLGLGVMLVTFGLVALYVRRSGRVFDHMNAELLRRHGR
ncbi:DUF485 domain-containing protein [Rhizosaccharibacter radicis]|uniref:DUF485 domain-containing protein n=1 Tax=Rhizosaccharibacter radicis TaxID=2782605 RepID=A0ABT1VUR3_9PROT|nr:DUF485 domain-containing protein [Acetobacteraceae bacterium KSS12]